MHLGKGVLTPSLAKCNSNKSQIDWQKGSILKFCSSLFYLFQALTYMKQINESERERETSWRDLPEAERADRERQLAEQRAGAEAASGTA